MAAPAALPSYRRSVFPPIPAPLQRLFDLVPLVVYPANALPGEDDVDDSNVDSSSAASPSIPSLYVFIDPSDARCGRASFNPTCLKWQAFLRFARVPVRLVASTNHASPSGALPFLQPPRLAAGTDDIPHNSTRRTRLPPPPPKPIPTSGFASFVRKQKQQQKQPASDSPLDSLMALDTRAPAYQALLDNYLRRAWLHAVYLDGGPDNTTIAARLYADAASSSAVVRASLAAQLQTAAAAQVWGAATATATTPTATATAHIYRDAQVALSALDTLLGENDDDEDTIFFFNSTTPTLFDAAVFAYTHLLLEDDDDLVDGTARRFCWHNTTLPDMVKAHARLVRHRNHIATQYWS